MTRRRLTLAIVATVFCGAAWWLSLDRLSAEERLVVGTWIYDGTSPNVRPAMRIGPDRQCAFASAPPRDGHYQLNSSALWYVRDGAVVFDREPSAIRRTVRPVLHAIGLPAGGAMSYSLDSIAADKLVLVLPDGTRATWTRASAD
jgi:hypothetical protein